MNLSLLDISTCPYCNSSPCICPKANYTGGLINSIGQRQLKRGKYITVVSGVVHQADFKTLRQRLGTGGVWASDYCTFRGKVTRRITPLLKQLGYRIP